MKRTSFSNHIEALQNEVLLLLRYYIAWKRIWNLGDLKTISRTNYVDRHISLKAIENDLLIRICKLDDKTEGRHSLQNALREVSVESSIRIKAEKLIKRYSAGIKNIKSNRRHTVLAHLKIDSSDDFELKYDFLPAIKMIIEIVDVLNQNKVSYLWKDGSYEKYDLREELFSKD